MSREAVNRVLELAPSRNLTHLEFRVLVYLADHLNKTTGRLDPGSECLAHDCGLPNPENAERNVRRAIDGLVGKGLVERIGPSSGGRVPGGHYPTRGYRLRLDAAASRPTESQAPGNPASVKTKAAGQQPAKGHADTGNQPGVASSNGKGDSRGLLPAVRVVMMTGEGGPHDHLKGGRHDPRTKEVDLEPGKVNPPSGSTTRRATRASRSDARATTVSASPATNPTTPTVDEAPPSKAGPEGEQATTADGGPPADHAKAPIPELSATLKAAPLAGRPPGRDRLPLKPPPTRQLTPQQLAAEQAETERRKADFERWMAEHPELAS